MHVDQKCNYIYSSNLNIIYQSKNSALKVHLMVEAGNDIGK